MAYYSNILASLHWNHLVLPGLARRRWHRAFLPLDPDDLTAALYTDVHQSLCRRFGSDVAFGTPNSRVHVLENRSNKLLRRYLYLETMLLSGNQEKYPPSIKYQDSVEFELTKPLV